MGKTKVIPMDRAMELIHDGSRIMVGGFLGCGSPHALGDAVFERGYARLTVISNDSTVPEYGVGKLIAHHRVDTLIASHIGTNPETGRQMGTGELSVELVPQGTLAERIRAAGGGLGGVITPTGVGTMVAEGKQTIELDGRIYLIELPLRAEVALIKAALADESGNLVMRGSARNMNPIMATACDVVICEADEIVPVGAIDPNDVTVPGIYVDHIVQGVRA